MAAKDATVWVQDYQMQLVPKMLRELRPDLRIGFFLHIPFPPAELFQQLPWRRQILEGLLGADIVGFQLAGGAANFVRLVRQRVGHKTHRDTVYLPDGRTVRAAAFPISIDSAGFEELARSESVGAAGRRDPRGARQPASGSCSASTGSTTPRASSPGCARSPSWSATAHFDVEEEVFVQVATPSRERVDQYRLLRDEIDRLVGRVNGDLGKIGHPAISYMHSSYPRHEMAALYRAADVMVVTPYRDGMNLVAKEYVACRFENDGALVLSEFAGAADELRQAWQVNPYDINGMKAAIMDAARAEPKETDPPHEGDAEADHGARRRPWAAGFLDALAAVPGAHGKSVRAPGRADRTAPTGRFSAGPDDGLSVRRSAATDPEPGPHRNH